MNEQLMRAVVESCIFFALSTDSEVNPDAAVSQLESIAGILKRMSPSEQEIFLTFIDRLANEEEEQMGPPDRMATLRSLPESLGLQPD